MIAPLQQQPDTRFRPATRPRPQPFELLLFTTDPFFARRATDAGVDGIIVDWEHLGKAARQAGADTEINHATPADLRRVRRSTDALVICRINRFGTTTREEVEQALEAGASEILLPMVQSPGEVEAVLEQVRGRCGVGILIETISAVALAEELGCLPLTRVYLGLNDLAIARRTPNIFTAVADGTLEYVRHHIRVPFGWGGLTLPERGHPIACRLLMGEMARLGCDFTFLRRSFCADVRGRNLQLVVRQIREGLHTAWHRPPAAVGHDQAALHTAIGSWTARAAT